MRALQGLVDFAKVLVANNVHLLSTGGTAKAIREAGLPVTDVSEFTGSPEVMDGRVKTLHPRVHGGILMRDTESDRAELLQLGGEPIEIVVVNLYPFSATVAKGAPFADCIENIDIGGPTMVRAAAKNHSRVTVAQHGQSACLGSAPQLGSCASSGRAWRLRAARHSQGKRPAH